MKKVFSYDEILKQAMEADPKEAIDLEAQVADLLKGKASAVQGVVLAQLTARWLAGYFPQDVRPARFAGSRDRGHDPLARGGHPRRAGRAGRGLMLIRADGHPVVILARSRYMERLHYKLAAKGRLPMWVVYHPANPEYPGYWTARMQIALPEAKVTRFVMTHNTLPDIRGMIPRGLVLRARHPEDAPEIYEVWL
jgi:hypothetical protein